MGLPSNHPTEIVDDLSELEENTKQSYDLLLAEAMSSRTEVKRFQSLLNAQQNYIQVAKGNYYPALQCKCKLQFCRNRNIGYAAELVAGNDTYNTCF